MAGDLTLSKAIMMNLMQQSHSLQAVPNKYTHTFSQPTEHAQCEVLLLKHFDVHVPLAVGYTGVAVYLSARLDLHGRALSVTRILQSVRAVSKKS